VVLLGIRAQDEYRLDLQAAGVSFRAVPQLRGDGAGRTAGWAREHLSECIGYWRHVDVDVLDPAVMPAVDAPDEGGIAYAELELLVSNLVATSDCLGMELTVFDPDYDPDGTYARELVASLAAGLAPLLRPEPEQPPKLILPTARPESPLIESPVEITRVPAPTRRTSRRPRGTAGTA
jgi:arginase